MAQVPRERVPQPKVRLSVEVPAQLHVALKTVAAERHLSLNNLVRELLETSLVLLGEGPAAHESLDDLAIRRELARASVIALGGAWDSETDARWQTFRP